MTWPDALPASRVPDPRDAPSLRWGVVGTGWIAERFVAALQKLTTQQVVAVGSRPSSSAAEDAVRLPTATTCWVVSFCSAATKRSAIQPVPITPQRSVGASRGSGTRGAGSPSSQVTRHLRPGSGRPPGLGRRRRASR